MTPQQMIPLIQDRFGPAILATFPNDKHPRFHIDAKDWRDIAQYLTGEPLRLTSPLKWNKYILTAGQNNSVTHLIKVFS